MNSNTINSREIDTLDGVEGVPGGNSKCSPCCRVLSIPPTLYAPHNFLESQNPNLACATLSEYRLENEIFRTTVLLVAMRLDFPDGQLSTADITDALLTSEAVRSDQVLGVAWND